MFHPAVITFDDIPGGIVNTSFHKRKGAPSSNHSLTVNLLFGEVDNYIYILYSYVTQFSWC